MQANFYITKTYIINKLNKNKVKVNKNFVKLAIMLTQIKKTLKTFIIEKVTNVNMKLCFIKFFKSKFIFECYI